MSDRVGEQIGNYHLLRLLGQGGFADVYLGEHIHLKSLAAIKVLYTRLTEDLQESFLNEARILARLSHPHIIRILDCGLDENVPYLVMDYAPEGTLRQRHPRGTRLPVETVVEYVRQITDGLQYAHSQKLIHRDLKPDNVLIGENGKLFLSDFGVALVAQTTRSRNPETNFAGTASYMAPEQLQGKPLFASDQYALGIMTYEWLCGTRPFQGSLLELYSQHFHTPPTPLREHVPFLAPEIEQVVLRVLAKDPAQRFANVTDFANALQQASQPSRPIAAFVLKTALIPPTLAIPQPTMLTPLPSPADFSTSLTVSPQEQIPTPLSAPSQAHLPTPVSNKVEQIPTSATVPVQQNAAQATMLQPLATPAQQFSAVLQATMPQSPPTISQASLSHTPQNTWSFQIIARAHYLRSKLSPGTLFLLAGLAALVILGASAASLYTFNAHTRGSSSSAIITATTGQTVTDNANASQTDASSGHFAATPTSTSTTNMTTAGQTSTPKATSIAAVSPTATPVSAPATSAPPTATPLPPTATPVPPTPTPLPPTATPVPPTPTPTPKPAPVCSTSGSTTHLIYQGIVAGQNYDYSNGGTYYATSGNCSGIVYVAFTSAPAVSNTQVQICTGYSTGCSGWATYSGVGNKLTVATGVATGTSFHLRFQSWGASSSFYESVTIYY